MAEEEDVPPELQEYLDHVEEKVLPMIENSDVIMQLVPEHPDRIDVKFCVELGISIMLDKPIIMIVRSGTTVPDHLVRVADKIVEWHDDPEVISERLQASMKEMDDEEGR